MRRSSTIRAFVAALVAGLAATVALGQEPPAPERPADAAKTGDRPAAKPNETAQPIPIVADAFISSNDTVTIEGQSVPYQVTLGTQPVWNADNKPVASVFYVFYRRTDVKDPASRPLLISFNGGPGSASLWMHLAYTGPRMVRIDGEGYPVQPYGVQENPHSVLDVADILYVDPVSTGFSRILEGGANERFFGVNEDIAYLARWIATFVTRQGRWTSPKYLIGESYGTTRVSGLAGQLQEEQWMFLNGVILVSPTDLGVDREGPLGAALNLPYYAATAWYHQMLPKDLQSKDLEALLPEVEAFTLDQLLPALARGGSLDAARRDALVAQYARYSGLKPDVVRANNCSIRLSLFWKELLRDQGLTVGRLDSRYRGVDRDDAGTSPSFDPAMAAWNHAFGPAINHYLRDLLGYKTDLAYWVFGPIGAWNGQNVRTGEQLRGAMAANPSLHVLVQSGYFDGATTYFDAKFTIWNIDPSGRFQDRIAWKGYRSGHMMYLREEDRARSTADLRSFIERTLPKDGVPVKR